MSKATGAELPKRQRDRDDRLKELHRPTSKLIAARIAEPEMFPKIVPLHH